MYYLSSALQDGSLWVVLASVLYFVGLVMSMTERGSGISRHSSDEAYPERRTEYPPDSLGRVELEQLLWRRHHSPRAHR